MKETYIVEIERPSNLSVDSTKEYIKEAVEGWAGGFHPDHPFFGWFDENLITITRMKVE